MVRRGERVAILGSNGLGKSTLLKIATGNLEADAGSVKWGHETRIGYFPQDHREGLADPSATPLDVVWGAVPTEATSYVRGQLGRVLFSGDDVTKKVGSLSGGEAARLLFCRIMVERPNVLVVPRGAVAIDGNRRFVYVVVDNRLSRREIVVGIASPVSYQVVSGLNEGDLVALPGEVQLKDKMKIQPVTPE